MKVRPTFGDNQLDYAGHDEEGERGEPRVKPQHKQNRKRDFGDADDMGDHDRRGKPYSPPKIRSLNSFSNR
jgi:hypothetical protein